MNHLLSHETPTTPHHPLFSESTEPHWCDFAHHDELLIDCLYSEANARLFETTRADYSGGLYSVEIFCTDAELCSLVTAAYYACDLKRGAA